MASPSRNLFKSSRFVQAMDQARQAVEALLAEHVKGQIALEAPEQLGFGDLAFPCFSLSKELKKSPAQIAIDLAKQLKPNAWVSKIEAKGPYVNFFLEPKTFAQAALGEVLKYSAKYGSAKIPEAGRILIEYPSPNTNKPLHLGHLRNIFLGQSSSNLLLAQGHTVIQANLNQDRGVHICKSMLAYQKWGNDALPNKKSDHYVGDWYVRFSTESKKNPELEKEAQAMLQKWEEEDPEIRALWSKMNKWALDGFRQTYRRLGLHFEKEYYEHEYYDKGKLVIAEGLKKGIFEKREDGAILVNLEDHNLPNKILLRGDGTSIYMTQDLYLAKLKFKDFEYDRSIYVVASEQNLHFQQLFKIFELLEYDWAKGCYHLSYGMVNLPSGKMKSREGTVVDADDLLDEVESLCEAEIKKRHPELPEAQITKRAKQIGLGALRFFILKQDPIKDMVYNPEESVALEGETGPYVQYAAVRIAAILRKHGNVPETSDASLLTAPEEHLLLKLVAKFPEVVSTAARQYKPSHIAHYLIELTQAFNSFYHVHQVLQAEPKLRDARLQLCLTVRQVLENGLGLLNIEVPEEM